MPFIRQGHKEKPLIYGSFQDRQYSIWRNLEDIYRVDHESEVLITPGFWGLPCWDYSKLINHGINYGANYKNGDLDFDGVDDNIDYGYAVPVAGAEGTLSLWLKGDGWVGSEYMVEWKTDNSNHLSVWQNGTILVGYYEAGDIVHNLIWTHGSPTNWIHVILSWSKSADEVRLYVDGLLKDSEDTLGVWAGTTLETPFLIGKRSAGNQFNGFINEVRASNVAYTTDQIALFHDRPWDLYRRVSRPIYSLPISSSSSSQSASSESISSSASISISTSNSSESISSSVSSSSESTSVSDSESSSNSESMSISNSSESSSISQSISISSSSESVSFSTSISSSESSSVSTSISSSSESASISQSSSASVSESISFSSESVSTSNSQSSSISISESTSLSSESISSSQSISVSISASSSSESISTSQSSSISESFSSSSESISISSSISASLSSSSQSISISSSISQSISSSSISGSASVSDSLSQSISFSSESISSSSSSSQSIFLGETREIFIIEPLQTAFKI